MKNIIDIRDNTSYNNYHINNSINIPKMVLLNNPEKYLNKNDEYYLICDEGILSMHTANILNALGYKCNNIVGGIQKYKNII